jgi:hypothetical protein
MKRLLGTIFLVSGMLMLAGTVSAQNIKKSENFNIKCEINQIKKDYYAPFSSYVETAKFFKTFNFNLSNYKWDQKKENFPINYYDEKKKEVITVFQGSFVMWDEVLEEDKMNKEYISKNSNNIKAQLFTYIWNINGEIVMTVYNLNNKYLKEHYSKIENRIKANFVIPKDDSIKKSISEKLNDDGYFSVMFRGKCSRI